MRIRSLVQTVLGRQPAQPAPLLAEEKTLRILRTALRAQPAAVRFVASREALKD
jgi:hypothetical protein